MGTRTIYLLPLLTMALVAVVACAGSDETAVDSQPSSESSVAAASESATDELELIKGPVSADGTQIIFATPDLGIGDNRVAFVLTSETGLIKAPAAAVEAYYLGGTEGDRGDDAGGDRRQTALGVFRPWPYGTRGIYTTRLDLAVPGRWALEVSAAGEDGSVRQAMLFFEVEETPATPAVGSPAIASKSKTLADVERISQITTGSMHDPDLYQLTIADALTSDLPTVVVMASPAFCTNAVCGPQVQVLKELKDKYSGQANFIHIDYYDNPEEIQGDLTRARVSPTVIEWSLPSTEWSFVIDRDGIVSDRFESFATLEELEQALQRVL